MEKIENNKLRVFYYEYKNVKFNSTVIKNCAFCKKELRKVKIKLYGTWADEQGYRQLFLCEKCIKKIVALSPRHWMNLREEIK